LFIYTVLQLVIYRAPQLTRYIGLQLAKYKVLKPSKCTFPRLATALQLAR
jgi:hypothetical protein